MKQGLLLLLLLAASPAPAADATAPGYVGASACASCHPAEFERWRGSHHDLAMQQATSATVLGDFDDASFTRHGVTSRFFRRDGKFMVRTDSANGELADYEVRYVFGVDPLQQYLLEFPGGRFQVLSLCWDSRPAEQGGQRWFHLYDEPIPAGDALHWTGPNQNWNHMCAECHSTNLRKGYRAASDDFDTRWSEIDVACEACHGPGSAHVAWAKRAAASDTAKAKPGDLGLVVRFEPIDGPARRWVRKPGAKIATRASPGHEARELDTCARCHARRSVIDPSYRHGLPLLDTHRPVSLSDGFYFPDGQIRDEVYVYGSFVQSKMHAAGVTCSDCHDSHSGELYAPGNALCGRCHEPAYYDAVTHHRHEVGSDGASCIACHMPARTYMQVDPRHDHSLRVPRPDLSDALGSPNACNGCHLGNSKRWAADKIEQWRGGRAPEPHWGSAIHAAREGSADGETQLLNSLRDPDTPAIARATVVSLLPAYASTGTGQALDAALEDPDPLVRSEAVLAIEALGIPAALQTLLGLLDDPIRTVRLEAARALAAVPSEQLDPKHRARRDALLEQYRAVQRMDADRADARLRLGSLALRQGDTASAEAELKTAIALDPSFVPAYVNLADVHRLQGRDEDGERVLRAGLAQDPQQPDLHYALGLLLVRTQRLPEALASLERAAELRPELPRYPYVYGLALQSAGQNAQAARVLREALKRHPQSREISQLLMQIEAGS